MGDPLSPTILSTNYHSVYANRLSIDLASDQWLQNSSGDYFFWANNLELPDEVATADRDTEIINAYHIAFFARYLKDEGQELLLVSQQDENAG